MGFLSLLIVASMPVLQFLLIGLLGAFLATNYFNILTPSAMRDINKVTYVVFAPALVFASLAKTVTLSEIITWWYMPVNIGLTFLVGGIFGWLAVKILKPKKHLEGLIISNCAAGNLGNLLLIIIPAVCNEKASPFGDQQVCRDNSLSYVAMSMALGNIFIWSVVYGLMQMDGATIERMRNNENSSNSSQHNEVLKIESKEAYDDHEAVLEQKMPLLTDDKNKKNKGVLNQLLEELTTPPIISAIVGFVVGVIPWLKSLIIGANAPLRVIQDSITLLGDGLVPCITLILGGNLTKGLGKGGMKPLVIIAIIAIRYIVLPIAGIGIVRMANQLGFLPQDPMFAYVLMIQFTLPPAMSIGTMSQLFEVGQEECSVIFLWTYLVAGLAVTIWSTIFMWVLT
ncbi:protein PIN-LIKES 7-like [Dioscorea cayenensis subsp. rotundata]|uniref:Protein PIN-LIKES 7-like n=1 Tax=Dioscorea cayennensis subsp. rotundata TaxID=55577 RepID=A0AB40AJY5_DIOCR|nr:protein PIN-LIKES 7-like [Dioscorea cayenensis subsp. rotundata]